MFGKQDGSICARDVWLVFIEECEASLLLSPVARLSHQMEGRVVVARLILSSGSRCNLALQAAGVVMWGWRRSLRSILWWQGNSSVQAAVIPFLLIKPALRCYSLSGNALFKESLPFYFPLRRTLLNILWPFELEGLVCECFWGWWGLHILYSQCDTVYLWFSFIIHNKYHPQGALNI